MHRRLPRSPLFPYTTLFRSLAPRRADESLADLAVRVERALARLDSTCGGCTVVLAAHADVIAAVIGTVVEAPTEAWDVFRIAPGTLSVVRDRKSTRLNSSHVAISYAVFCL